MQARKYALLAAAFALAVIALAGLACGVDLGDSSAGEVAEGEHSTQTETEASGKMPERPTVETAEETRAGQSETEAPGQESIDSDADAPEAKLWSWLHESHYKDPNHMMWTPDQFPVTYEFLTYNNLPGIQLRVEAPFLSLYPDDLAPRYDLQDTEAEIFLAIPEPKIGLAMVCRQQETAGENYVFLINQDTWWITKNGEGEAVILSEGPTSENFRNGGWEMFRFRCEGDRLSAWDSAGLLGEAVDAAYGSGAAGKFFIIDPDQSPGTLYLFRETAKAREETRTTGRIKDTWERNSFLVQFSETWIFHELHADLDEGQEIMSLGLGFENRGTEPVTIESPDIFLGWGEFHVPAQPEPPGSVADVFPLRFPLTIEPGTGVSGKVFFRDISAVNLSEGWWLVVNLEDQGIGVMSFEIPVQ